MKTETPIWVKIYERHFGGHTWLRDEPQMLGTDEYGSSEVLHPCHPQRTWAVPKVGVLDHASC